MISRVALVIEMSMRALAMIDHPETATPLQRIRLIFARDALVQTLDADELRMFRIWSEQELPS